LSFRLFAFSIQDDWTFEEGFSSRKNVKIYSYDYSTEELLNRRLYRVLKSSAAIIYHSMRLQFYRVKDHLRKIRLRTKLYGFFDEKQGRYYIPKFIGGGGVDNDIYTCFETIFRNLGKVRDLSVFVKIDIEGGEYICLSELIPYFDSINGLAIEFHAIGECADKFEFLLDKILEKFHIAHIHGCNYGKLIDDTNIPDVLEITFINKKIVPEQITLSKKTYPIEGLDFPSNPYKKDYTLPFDS
jgi:hypothetical protein